MIEGLKVYSTYQDSRSGFLRDVPAHWALSRLRSLLVSRSERNRPQLPLLSVARERGVFVRSRVDRDENHNAIPDDLGNYKVARAGDLVINKMKAWQGSMGIAPCLGIVSPAYYVFDIKVSEKRYAEYLLRSKAYVALFAQASDGVRVGQWDLSFRGLREIPVAIPPLDEQRAIVRFLDYADRRIRKYIAAKRKLIALLEEQKQAIIHRAVTRGLDPHVRLKDSGVPWIGMVPEHWELQRLKWVAWLQRGFDLPAESRKPGDAVVVSSGGIIGTHNEARCLGPGVVIGRYGSTEAVFYLDQPYWPHNTSLFVLDFFANSARWCFYLLRTISKKDHASKSAVPGVDRKDLHDIVVPLAPPAEQTAIAGYLDDHLAGVDKAVSAIDRQITHMRDFRIRLISDVVTGKLDVRSAAVRLPDEIPDDSPTDAIDADEGELDDESVDDATD